MAFLKNKLVYGSCLAVCLVMAQPVTTYASDAKADVKAVEKIEKKSSKKAEKPPVKLTTDIRTQFTSENDMDLGDDSEGGSDSQLLELKSKLEARSGNLSGLIEARVVENYGDGGSFDVETGETTSAEDFAELRQYWAAYDNLFGQEGLSIKAGRQRIREDYGFWWNRDQDALRLDYEAAGVQGFFGVGQNLGEYRSSGDAFNQDDQDILRVFAEVSKEYVPSHFIEGRFMYQDDHSGIERNGTLVKADDFDGSDADLVWMGLRLHGSYAGVEAEDAKKKSKKITAPTYRVDLAAVTGEEDDLSSSVGPGVFRTVTGHTSQDVFGWAVDAGVDVPVPVVLSPVLHLGYAYGSGDDNSSDGDDDAFRQTGLDGNSSRLGGFSASLNNYGSVLRPDLSNLHIATIGATVPLTEATELAGYYRYYRLAEEDGGLTASVTAGRNGEDTDLGQGFDLILNMNVAEQFSIEQNALDRINFRTTLGAFTAGDAYGDNEGDTALRGQVDFGIRF